MLGFETLTLYIHLNKVDSIFSVHYLYPTSQGPAEKAKLVKVGGHKLHYHVHYQEFKALAIIIPNMNDEWQK